MGLFGLFGATKTPAVRTPTPAMPVQPQAIERRFALDRTRFFDLAQTQRLEQLIATPAQLRDSAWTEAFLDAAWHASVVVSDPALFEGPDGFPYYRLSLPDDGIAFDSQSLGNLARQCCERHAGAAIFARTDDPVSEPQFVFTMGLLDSMMRFDSPEGDPLDRIDHAARSFGATTQGPPLHQSQVTTEPHQVAVGTPATEFLPAYAAHALARYMTTVWGIEGPRVALMLDPAIPPGRHLVLGRPRNSFPSEEERTSELRRLAWYLPRWRSMMLMPEQWHLAELTPLAELSAEPKVDHDHAIETRAGFAAMLDTTMAEIDLLARSEPDYPVWRSLQHGLMLMHQYSASRAGPSHPRPAVNIGLIAARELEPAAPGPMQGLIDRLYLLSQYWQQLPGAEPVARGTSSGAAWKVAGIASLAILVLAGVAMVAKTALMTEQGPWTAIGSSMAVDGGMASIETSVEPYMVSLNHNSESERLSVRLHVKDTLVPLASGVPLSGLRFGAELLGDDGQQLWFYVQQIGGWDYRREQLIAPSDLRAANPAIRRYSRHDNSNDPLISEAARTPLDPPTDIWSSDRRMYAFSGGLNVTSPDFQDTYSVDPQTLRAELIE